MKPGGFTFDGVDSETIHALIQSRPLIEAPQRKYQIKTSYGVDGQVPYDEGSYDNTDLELVMLTNGTDLIADRQKLYNLMDTRGVYKDFIPYFDPDKIYRVMLSDKMQFVNDYTYGQVQAVSAKFTVKPYKYLVANNPIIINGTTGKVTNPTNYVSQPIITITANGNVTLKINGINFNISNVPGSITIDSERYIAYKQDSYGILTPMNNLVTTREFPVFNPGDNTINVIGTVSQLNIQPRWRSLV
jgi:phage-related protein